MEKVAKKITRNMLKMGKTVSPLSVGVMVIISGAIFYFFDNYQVRITKKWKGKDKPITFFMFSDDRYDPKKKK